MIKLVHETSNFTLLTQIQRNSRLWYTKKTVGRFAVRRNKSV